MTKYSIAFVLLLVVTITNTVIHGLKEADVTPPASTPSSSPAVTDATIQAEDPVITEADLEELRVWKEAEYGAHHYTVVKQERAKKPAGQKVARAEGKAKPAKSTKKGGSKANREVIVSQGIEYVKIPFKGKYIYVSRDYYKVNGVRKPVTQKEAERIARQHGAVLPTKEMVDTIWKYADLKLRPQPLKAGPLMTQPIYFVKHNRMIEEQIGNRDFTLVAGHKKDVVRQQRAGRVTIYGWHRLNASPIQPVSNVHDDDYTDYSNCLRLVKLHT